MPNNAFKTEPAGAHSHTFTEEGLTGIINAWNMSWSGGNGQQGEINGGKTSTDGEHIHAITGGDKETRPYNVNVNYLIKH